MIGAISYSAVIILDGVQGWSESPVIISVDSLANPIREIEFPSLTLCPDREYQPDYLAIAEHVFNSFSFFCEKCDDSTQSFGELVY